MCLRFLTTFGMTGSYLLWEVVGGGEAAAYHLPAQIV